MKDVILSVSGLETTYKTGKKEVKALRNLYLDVKRGETLALVGESGSGKSTLGLSILRLIEPPNEISNGKIVFNDSEGDVSILDLSLPEIRKFRWKKISMIFQSAMNVLNPIARIEEQFIDTFQAHDITGDYNERINHYLEISGLGENVRKLYPHQLSGGMKQRVSIALALCCEPDLLIADEPTTALDVVVQKEVLLELNRLKQELNLSIIFITHDLRVASSIADRIGIFYAGRIIEMGKTEDVIKHPSHPYAQLLLSSIITTRTPKNSVLITLTGSPPDLSSRIIGCSFYPRCPVHDASCLTFNEEKTEVSKEHFVECIRPGVNVKDIKMPENIGGRD